MGAPIQQITVLGSTGSIGQNTLDVIRQHPERFAVFALTANSSAVQMADQIRVTKPRYAVMRDETAAAQLRRLVAEFNSDTEILSGVEALSMVAAHPEVDQVMAAIVGGAGLLPTMAAVKAGKKVLLANKEALVMSGELFMQAARRSGADILPIDSEHNAIWQCLPAQTNDSLKVSGVKRILLTGSGGPFRDLPLQALREVTPDQACAHPNWSMGRKISVDSATMMNKGLEFIEACWLFDLTDQDIEIVIHRQSLIHSMVEYIDGSVLAQMGNPDMRTPIAYGLGWPQRISSGVQPMDFTQLIQMNFEPLDISRFPCIKFSIEAAKQKGTAAVVLNASNEVAVEAFLREQISFTAIAALVGEVMDISQYQSAGSIETILEADSCARELTRSLLGRYRRRR